MIGAALAYAGQRPDELGRALLVHLGLSAGALAIALAIALPLGVRLSRRAGPALAAINGANVAKTVPSLAVLALMLPLLGTGFLPALVALVLLAIPPVLVNTVAGLRGVDAATVEAARAVGMTPGEIARRVELPLALPVIFAGIRAAAVEVVASATLASFIGGGGLGDFITAGIAMSEMAPILVGAVPVALLTIATELGCAALQRALTSPGLRAAPLRGTA